jgi:hypothetical protein
MRLVLFALVGLLVVAAAAAKEGAVARLTTPLPLSAAPGTAIRVSWAVEVPDGKGGREPFTANQMFVRLLSRTGAAATTAYADTVADGGNVAMVTVPAGGIGGVRVGLRGTACDAAGCRASDAIFPVANDPFVSPGGARCDVAATRAALDAFVRAYDDGDLRRLDALFSRDRFVWYSSAGPGVRRQADAADRSTLAAYFGRRHARGDRLRRLALRFDGYERGRDLGHFELGLERRADDFRGGAWLRVSGKGALDCARKPVTIAALSLGAPRR